MTCFVLKKVDDNTFETVTSKITPQTLNKNIPVKLFYKHLKQPYVYKGKFNILSCKKQNSKTKLVLKLQDSFETIDIPVSSVHKNGLCLEKKDVADFCNYEFTKQDICNGYWFQ